jgi:hypothetical protein
MYNIFGRGNLFVAATWNIEKKIRSNTKMDFRQIGCEGRGMDGKSRRS